MAEFKSRKAKHETLRVADVIFDSRLQMRPEGEDPAHVRDLESAIDAKSVLPDIWVARIPEMGDHVIDGFQRLRAYQNKGKRDIAALVFPVDSFAEALWLAAPANANQNAAKRTAAGKRNAVRSALLAMAEAKVNHSNRSIAEHCSVSHALVAEIKGELKAEENIKDAVGSAKSTGRDGVERTAKRTAPKAENSPSIAGTWRQMPLDEGGLNTIQQNLDVLAKAKCVTVGDVYDQIVGGGIAGLAPYTAKALFTQMQSMTGYDGLEAIPVTKIEKFDWSGFESELGSAARRINVIAIAAGGVDGRSEAVQNAFRIARNVYDRWKADIIEEENTDGQA